MRTCANCDAYNPTNWVSHSFSGASYQLCDDCYAPVLEREAREAAARKISRAERLQPPCAICGERTHLHWNGTMHNAEGNPVHRACQRRLEQAQQRPQTAWATYHDKPMSELTPTERRWEEQYREDDLDRMAAG